ncbi:MAG: IPT/TIG domain-containing protein [Calditrichaceae bacterium]|nr:IPT/TIG domain-containing protein [Calditrichaceae bacterium]
MKIFQFSLYKILILIFLIFFVITCGEYDVASPQWDQDFEDVPIPIITSVSPVDVAVAGVNTITITGENFLDVPDSFGVYFNTVPTEVISSSTTSLVVRRPNIVAEAATIKVVPTQALVVANHSPYQIDPVLESFISFEQNIYSYAIAVDPNENIYVMNTEGSIYSIIKIDTSGAQKILGTCNFEPSKLIIGPDGRLYITRISQREILVFDENTDTQASRWTRLPRGFSISYGVFNSEGYFFAGGDEGGLISIAPNPDISDPTVNETGFYTEDEILGLNIYQNYIYAAVLTTSPDAQHPELAIWRHALTDSGTVGEMELALDLSSNTITASSTINTFKFDENGNLFIGIDGKDPLLINYAGTGNIDYFYKSILPSDCRQFCWGHGDFIYLIVDEKSDTKGDGIYRVNMGASEGS